MDPLVFPFAALLLDGVFEVDFLHVEVCILQTVHIYEVQELLQLICK